jgi:glycosyltransferase involved in cell wall biosynthesis
MASITHPGAALATRPMAGCLEMKNKPLVSIIIIFLNAARFLEEAIESVYAQSYDNWELLLTDDGSTDASTALAWQYVARGRAKVRYLEHYAHQNRGMSASRNLGIRRAKGEYIAFLDADDVWLPHKLAQQVAIMESHPAAAMVYGATQYWRSWTGNSEDLQRDYTPNLGVQANTLVSPPTLLTLFLLGEAAVPSPCDIMVRREIIEEVGEFEEEFQSLYEDQVFYAKVCLKAPVFVSDQCWDRYRQHSGSACSVASRAGLNDAAWLKFLSWIEKYLTQQKVKDAILWQALQRRLQPYRQPILRRLFVYGQHSMQKMRETLRKIAQSILPPHVYQWLRAQWRGALR